MQYWPEVAHKMSNFLQNMQNNTEVYQRLEFLVITTERDEKKGRARNGKNL